MHKLSLFFSQHEDLTQVLLYACVITGLWFAEMLASFDGIKIKWKHTSVNTLFIFTALPIQLVLTTFVVLISGWATAHHWGLINFIPFHTNPWVYYVVMFMMMDFCEYVYHVIMHKIEPLWKFHLVHHSDLKVDVSTTIREHPCETCIRTCFLMLWVFICGPAISVLILRQTFQSFSNIVAHTEFQLPSRLNKIIGLVFITPNLHHVHHHYQLPYTDCNYGDVLSIWDRLFGTYTNVDRKDIIFGIDTHMDENLNGRFLNVLKLPFQKFDHPQRRKKV
ncbi:sterol desaturase family protein [Mucilaginibacter sp. OK283]|jgi:sterol desaturase/sphingolipid hydroxylase (fatty acid hydroxylase superfamily)|uniref:sterol desaturase family protein n=1 Tax=Mucilaginibacter sp. OK283 TaxID=1881049 RepID=UPI0008BC5884|nr:sterol desaturase family protein [Mucilaginibacter sp. OK283]SEP02706.1 Sterol desaturase/sphingolipid hydroxylase, fatty acid hydroxylase superfamily [Mucilaginibacter sp. OK283]